MRREAPAASRDDRWRLLALVAGAALLHVAAWRHGGTLEHLGGVAWHLDRLDAGRPWVPSAGSVEGLTGGGPLYPALIHALRRLGGGLWTLQALAAALDIAAVAALYGVLRRRASPLVAAGAGIGLATLWIPKQHLAENSTFGAVFGTALFTAVVVALDRRGLAPVVVACVSAFLLVHFTLVGLLVIPVAAGALALRARGRGGAALAPTGAVLVSAVVAVPALWRSRAAVSPFRAEPLIPDEGLQLFFDAVPWGALIAPVAWIGLAVAVAGRGEALGLPRRVGRLATAWFLAMTGGVAAAGALGLNDAYHLATIAPARAVLSGLGLAVVLRTLVARAARGSTGGEARIANGILGIWLVGILAIVLGPWAGEGGLETDACEGLRAPPCDSRVVLDLRERLAVAGLLPDRGRLEYHGAWASCLDGASAWLDGGLLGGERGGGLLLVGAGGDEIPGAVALPDVEGGPALAPLFAVPGVLAVPREPGARPRIEAGRSYVELEIDLAGPGAIAVERAGLAVVLQGCLEDEVEDSRQLPTGWLILDSEEPFGAAALEEAVGTALEVLDVARAP